MSRRVVPGLPPDQYNFTLGLSVAAGLILGFVTQLEPQGGCRARLQGLFGLPPL